MKNSQSRPNFGSNFSSFSLLPSKSPNFNKSHWCSLIILVLEYLRSKNRKIFAKKSKLWPNFPHISFYRKHFRHSTFKDQWYFGRAKFLHSVKSSCSKIKSTFVLTKHSKWSGSLPLASRGIFWTFSLKSLFKSF